MKEVPDSSIDLIIRIASNEHDVVFDPFMGAGSTGHAALNLNRRFVGMEIDKIYYDAAAGRLTPLQQEKKHK